ncbi:hypothetical protein EJB05_08132, partial [Eragrostis curvula]
MQMHCMVRKLGANDAFLVWGGGKSRSSVRQGRQMLPAEAKGLDISNFYAQLPTRHVCGRCWEEELSVPSDQRLRSSVVDVVLFFFFQPQLFWLKYSCQQAGCIIRTPRSSSSMAATARPAPILPSRAGTASVGSGVECSCAMSKRAPA